MQIINILMLLIWSKMIIWLHNCGYYWEEAALQVRIQFKFSHNFSTLFHNQVEIAFFLKKYCFVWWLENYILLNINQRCYLILLLHKWALSTTITLLLENKWILLITITHIYSGIINIFVPNKIKDNFIQSIIISIPKKLLNIFGR